MVNDESRFACDKAECGDHNRARSAKKSTFERFRIDVLNVSYLGASARGVRKVNTVRAGARNFPNYGGIGVGQRVTQSSLILPYHPLPHPPPKPETNPSPHPGSQNRGL